MVRWGRRSKEEYEKGEGKMRWREGGGYSEGTGRIQGGYSGVHQGTVGYSQGTVGVQ